MEHEHYHETVPIAGQIAKAVIDYHVHNDVKRACQENGLSLCFIGLVLQLPVDSYWVQNPTAVADEGIMHRIKLNDLFRESDGASISVADVCKALGIKVQKLDTLMASGDIAARYERDGIWIFQKQIEKDK